MYKEYMEKLMDVLEHTTFYSAFGTEEIASYEEGMKQLIEYISEIKIQQKQLFFIGNGGSSAIASHMTADFMKNGGMKTYSLYDNAVTTCMGNDYGYEFVFSRPLAFLINEGDLLIAISSSGNSPNIVHAIDVAIEKKAKVITLSGFQRDNKIRKKGNYSIYVPIDHYGIVESIHNIILQQVVDEIVKRDGVSL